MRSPIAITPQDSFDREFVGNRRKLAAFAHHRPERRQLVSHSNGSASSLSASLSSAVSLMNAMVSVWVFGVLGVGLLWLGFHPLMTYPLSLWLIRWSRYCPAWLLIPFDLREKFGSCSCADNEERVIGAKVDDPLALCAARPDLQILFHVDAATDRTAEFPQDRDVGLYVAPQLAGKTHGMNRLTKLDAVGARFHRRECDARYNAAAIRAPKSGWSVTAR